MLATLSMRTPPSAAVCATSLPALLSVALSLPSELPPTAGLVFACCGAAGIACATPSRDFSPSKPLRMSIAHYSLPDVSASLSLTLVIHAVSSRYRCADSRLPEPLWAEYQSGKGRQRCDARCQIRPARSMPFPAPPMQTRPAHRWSPRRNRRPLQSRRRSSSVSTIPSSSALQTRVPPAPVAAAAPPGSPVTLLKPGLLCPASEHLQVGFERAGCLHRLQDRDHVARSCPGSLQFLHQILHCSALFQVNTVHRLVLGLHSGLLHHLRRSRRHGPGLRHLYFADHVHA